MAMDEKKYDGLEIAIIGISGHFPKSENYRKFWQNLVAGEEMLKTFTDEELRNSGVSENMIQDKLYVKTMGVLDNKDQFDRGFFGYSAEEASFMDPQIRLFHEHCWKALEDAGYASLIEKRKIGLFGASSSNDTWKIHTYKKADSAAIDPFYLNMLASQNFISSLTSYKLNLTGPAYYIDTACSSSLIAVHMACRSLLTKECDIALAGGVSIKTQRQKGYSYKEGMVRSVDGHCRAFDYESSGTASGEGIGIVVLKKLNEAIAERDNIYAIIKGSATNDDGNRKVGFTAPSIQGQAECIKKAHKFAGVEPDSIGYVEAHGTATKLGDPIEISALNEAFASGRKEKYCAIGSVKTNIGHLDAAAGVTGLIKTALCLHYQKIPASLNYKKPNPEIDFDSGPFYVNTSLLEWQRKNHQPLRAGISSFGMGGTNAHVVMEEWTRRLAADASNNFKLLTLSAKTESSLNRYFTQLYKFLFDEPGVDLEDMAYSFNIGRRPFIYRKSIVYRTGQELSSLLAKAITAKEYQKSQAYSSVVFMFPGQGSQYVNMTHGLYMGIPVFRKQMDLGFAILEKLTGIRFQDILYAQNDISPQVDQTRYTQPLIFLTQYSLAQTLLSMGINCTSMIGHSIGEYVCACISGVFSFEDSLRLVVKRAELMSNLPGGVMLSAAINLLQAKDFICEGISLAAVNSHKQVVFSGDSQSVSMLMNKLQAAGIPHIELHTSHAFHSAMMEPILEDFRRAFEDVTVNHDVQPAFISNLTGQFIKKEEACSPEYWVEHLRNTVLFADGIETLLSTHPNAAFIEVGSGSTLTNLLKQATPDGNEKLFAINIIRSFKDDKDDMKHFISRIGKLWEAGVYINWELYHQHDKLYRVSLPTYSFEPERYISEADPFEGTSVFNNPQKQISGDIETDSWEAPIPLPDKKLERPALSNPYCGPVTETEKILVDIMENFFGIRQIGTEDNFFELGGDSLKAMALLQQIKNRFALTFTLKEMFEYKDIKQIATGIDERIWLNKQSEKQFTTII